MANRDTDIKQIAEEIYNRFKLYFYREVFSKSCAGQGESESLTTVESFCMEMIYSLGTPTISEFANITGISSANAADKVNHLIKKGFITKQQCEDDKRKYLLKVTEKYMQYHEISSRRLDELVNSIHDNFSKEEVDVLMRVLHTVSAALDPDYLLRRDTDS